MLIMLIMIVMMIMMYKYASRSIPIRSKLGQSIHPIYFLSSNLSRHQIDCFHFTIPSP